MRDARLSLLDELRVVQVATVWRNAEVLAEILGAGTFLPSQQRFVDLLAVASADFADLMRTGAGRSMPTPV